MSYETEFPAKINVPGAIVELVRDKVLTDESWGNDVCPHFEAILIGRTNDEHNTVIQLWSDYEDRNAREFDCKRFRVIVVEDGSNPEMTSTDICETEDVYEAIKAVMSVIERAKTHTAERPDGGCIFNQKLLCVLCGESFPGYHEHTKDEDCCLSPGGDGTCDLCGVSHGAPCDECGGKAFHRANCSQIEPTSDVIRMGKAFVETLEDWLTPSLMAEIAAVNKNNDEHTCASHDHVDANEAMLEAFHHVHPGVEFDPANQAQADEWNAAWAHAKELIDRKYGHLCDDDCRSNGCTERHK